MTFRHHRTPFVVLLALSFAVSGLAQEQPAGGRGQGGRGAGPQGRGLGQPPRDTAPGRSVNAGTAVVSGMLMVAGTGQPARHARVTLNGTEGGGARTATTDEFGRFIFSALPAGRYILNATKPGHVGVTYGQTLPGRPGTPIELAEGGKFSATLELPRGGVITGTVVDEYGDATAGIPVRVLRYVTQGGRRTLQQSGNGATTDDRGTYRIFGLQPGEYIVSAIPRNPIPVMDIGRLQAPVRLEMIRSEAGAPPEMLAKVEALQAQMVQGQSLETVGPDGEGHTGYAPVYYPGTASAAQAASIPLGVGEERPSVDFQLQRVPMARVEGTVVTSGDIAAQGVQLVLTDAGQAGAGLPVQTARADAQGRFRITNVPPGNYRLVARATAAGAAQATPAPQGGRGGRGNVVGSDAIRLWGLADVPVDGRDLTELIVTLQPGLSISGRVAFEATSQTAPADSSRVRVTLSPVDQPSPGAPQAASAMADASGRFTIPSVVPGTYRLTATGAGTGWLLESTTIDGQDALDFPFDIRPGGAAGGAMVTFSDRGAGLSGAITNGRGEAAPNFTLILYPADERYWAPQSRRIRSTRPATTGGFTFGELPPGDYKLAALADVEPGAWSDPAFLQQIDPASMRLTIRDGEKKVQNIQVAAGGSR